MAFQSFVLSALALCNTVFVGAQFLAQSSLEAHLSREDIESQVEAELTASLGHGSSESVERLLQLQHDMKPLFEALPKTEDRRLESGVARYALHRFFVQRHGWHVRGLEATGLEKWREASSTVMLEDRIPGYALEHAQKRLGQDEINLQQLSVLAATLEDLVHSEAIKLLSRAFAAQSVDIKQSLSEEEADRLVRTYLLFHIMPSPRYANLTTGQVNQVLERVKKFYTGWEDTLLWVSDLKGAEDNMMCSRRNPFVTTAPSYDFESVSKQVESIGEHYGQFQNIECRSLKNSLTEMSDGSGRVRLSDFYKPTLAGQSRHFSESSEYLKHLGALDETDPQRPSVILANYLYARSNCLASSSFYSVCCIDQCEGLMSKIELRSTDGLSTISDIAAVVSAQPSETVSAPRNLSSALVSRLGEIAHRHGGRVPLHGRLFAQWMHHVYPNECRYPHVTGTLSTPKSPLEWIQTAESRTIKASPEEMAAFTEAAAKDLELENILPVHVPWTEEEELVAVMAAHTAPQAEVTRWGGRCALLLAMFSAAAGVLRVITAPISRLPVFSGKGSKSPGVDLFV